MVDIFLVFFFFKFDAVSSPQILVTCDKAQVRRLASHNLDRNDETTAHVQCWYIVTVSECCAT
jgi:hypothetical protein